MAKQINRLSHVKVAAATKKGLYPDGGGLFLQVSRSGSKSWIFRYKVDGRTHDLGLGSLLPRGSFPAVSLAEARQKAAAARSERGRGVDPLTAKRAGRAQAKLEAA